MALRLRRGTDAERLLVTPAEGELVYVTDTKKLFVGDGTTAGGVAVDTTGGGGGGATVLTDLTDVEAGAVADGEYLQYNASQSAWVTVPAPSGGTGDGVVAGNSYEINILGSDSSTMVDTGNLEMAASTMTANDFIGDLTGNVTGDLTGNVVATNVVSTNFQGDLVGDVNGTVTGELLGPVKSNDGLVTVLNPSADGASAQYTGSVTGNVTGNLTGDVTGSVDGDLTGSVYSDGSTLLVDGVAGSLLAEAVKGTATLDRILVKSEADNYAFAAGRFERFYDDNGGATISVLFNRGTIDSPAPVQAGDATGQIIFGGWDGNDISSNASIKASVDPDGTVADEQLPGLLEFVTNNSSGAPITRASIDSAGTFRTFGIHAGITSAPTGMPFYSIGATNFPGVGPRLGLAFSRGTTTAPAAVQDTDVLHRIQWRGHDGTDYIDSAKIVAKVDGTVSTNVVPTNVEIHTTDAAGSTAIAATFKPDQGTTFGNYAKLANMDTTTRDALTGENGMMIYNTTTNKVQAYANGVWVDLH